VGGDGPRGSSVLGPEIRAAGPTRGGPGQLDGETGARSSTAVGSPFAAFFVGLAIDPAVGLPVVSWSLSAAFGVVLFALLIRRSLPDEPPTGGGHHSALAALALALALEPTTTIAGSPVPGETATVVHGTRPEIPAGEANLPRWLRPSLREQRRSGQSGDVTGR